MIEEILKPKKKRKRIYLIFNSNHNKNLSWKVQKHLYISHILFKFSSWDGFIYQVEMFQS
jgi:hypothetical protein